MPDAQAVEQNGVSSVAPTDSAPQKQAEVVSQVEVVQKQPTQEVRKSIFHDLTMQREKTRNLRNENEEFKSQLSESNRRIADLERTLRKYQEEQSAFNDDVAPKVSSLPAEEVRNIIRDELNDFVSKQQVVAEAQEAEKWLLSQPHFKNNPAGLSEVEQIIQNDVRLLSVARVSPRLAAEEANRRFMNYKSLNANTSASRAVGVSPSTPISSSLPTYSRDQVKALMSQHPQGSKEWKTVLREMEKAEKEGRIIK